MNELMGMEGSDEEDCGSEKGRMENKLMFKSASTIVLIARMDRPVKRKSEVPVHSFLSDASLVLWVMLT